MICACGEEYEATNQHSECPSCGKKAGTESERENDTTLARVISWFEDWVSATEEARKLAIRDRAYYDGQQWTEEEIATLQARGQPVVVKNRIFKKINFLLGMEVKNRQDPRALPRTPAHDDDVQACTDALRYVCDDQDFDQVGSRTWSHELIEGVGGAVVEVGKDAQVLVRKVAWDRLWWDIHSREPDYSDASHLGLSVWFDLEDAEQEYKGKPGLADDYEDILEQALSDGQVGSDDAHEDKPSGLWTKSEGGRNRIRVSECYFRDEEGAWMFCAYTKSGFVIPPRPTGYLDEDGNDVCPLIMVSAFVTPEGLRYGLVRHMIGPQDEINKRSSKALHLLSTRQVMAEEGAVLQPDEARTEMAKPDGWIELQRGALVDGRIQVSQTGDMAQGQFALLNEAKLEIDTIGPEIPQIGGSPAATSGRALMMRQQIGSLELAPLEDNHKRWKRAVYRHIWYRIRQFWPEEKWVRVRDEAEDNGFRFTGLNRKTTKAQRMQELMAQGMSPQDAIGKLLGPMAPIVMQQATQAHEMLMRRAGPQAMQAPPEQHQAMLMQIIMQHAALQEPITAADVAHLDVDIILDENPDTAILQQEEFENLTSIMPTMVNANPSLAPFFMELVIEASQLRAKKRLLEMLRKPKGPDPMAVQAQRAQLKMQLEQAQAGIAVAQSQAQLNQAKAAKEAASATTTVPLAQAEIDAKQANAWHNAANAGEKTGRIF